MSYHNVVKRLIGVCLLVGVAGLGSYGQTQNTVPKYVDGSGTMGNSHVTDDGVQVSVTSGDFTLNNNLNIPSSTGSGVGVINLGPGASGHWGVPAGVKSFIHACCGNPEDMGNTFVGFGSGNFSVSSFYNTGLGYATLGPLTDGYYNTATGTWALFSMTGGGYNTANGLAALWATTSGTSNTAIGYAAGGTIVTGSYNTFLGVSADATAPDLTNATAIGALATVGASNSLVLGGTGAMAVKVGIGTPTPSNVFTIAQGSGRAISDGWDVYSSRRYKTNIQTLDGSLGKVLQLRGVSYDLKATGKREIGVIAEEVGAVVPEVVTWEKNGVDAQSVDYGRLVALLIEATKEEQRVIRAQQAQIDAQQTRLEAQQGQIAELISQVTSVQAALKVTPQTDSVAIAFISPGFTGPTQTDSTIPAVADHNDRRETDPLIRRMLNK